jgi:hypothetical protein
MTDRNKFEEMLEKLVNEDRAGAEELFHEIVVEKSRDIYESLLETDLEDTEVDEASDEDDEDEEVDESDDEEVDESDEELDEDFNLDEFEVEAGDPADDMMADLGMGDKEGDSDEMSDEGDEELEDRVMDLEDALADLKAEFEREIGGEDDEADDEMDMGDEEGDDEMDSEEEPEEEPEEESFNFEATETKSVKSAQSAGEQMREYVEKVNGGFGAKIGGDNGANTKSTVASKNDMGGTASNLNQGKDNEAGDHAGLGDMNAKDQTGGNVNVPGGKASKSMKAQPKGHGAEKKGAGETSANTKSIIGK